MSKLKDKKNQFGTAPVFFTAISTILGAIMFLRFDFAVGNVGLMLTFAIILLSHAVTIPTAMALAEIATNQKVEGGGEYFIISRSFGIVIGATIGLALYLSQAISVAFYVIAFAEAFKSLSAWLLLNYNLPPTVEWLLLQKQTIAIPGLLLLTAVVLKKGADLGVKMLYFVVVILAFSLVAFFMGSTEYAATEGASVVEKASNPISFFVVFAIIFPAFTGMTAGVGLSGDLKDPSRSIPLGTLAGTLTGMVVYVLIALKLWSSAPLNQLADTNTLSMAEIAWQGWWVIPLGLAAATISSALGSLMVAPRTLQAIARDNILPGTRANSWLSRGTAQRDEPFNAYIITFVIALFFIILGDIDFVAQIISMFFMVTYGSLCLISFLQHFAANPSYRPTFKSKWYLSLMGAIACIGLMFFMNAFYAIIALFAIILTYLFISYFNKDKKNMAVIFQGVIFQMSRQLKVFLQKSEKEKTQNWRPSVVCISQDSFERIGAFQLLSWISERYGFGTYIHKIEGYLSKKTNQEAQEALERLIQMAESNQSNVYIDTLISPSFTSAIAQIVQLPGISGKENNMLMFEYSKNQPENLDDLTDNFQLIRTANFDVMILGSSEKAFGFKQAIHIWITSNDYENANLMILLAYIISGHKDWSKGYIKIFAIYPEETLQEEQERLLELTKSGRLPISPNNIELIPRTPDTDTKTIISKKSSDADLTIIGFRSELLKHEGANIFSGYDSIGNVLFVSSSEGKRIV